MSQPLLTTRGLTKKYGDVTALDSLDLDVEKGEVFGYIGPNGAGKTTTFRILCGLLDPTSGTAHIDGQDVTHDKDRLKQKVGFLPDNFGVYPTLRVSEYLDFFAAAYKVPKKQRPARIDYCLEIANSMEFKNKLMGGLSRGMKQRVGIAKTLLHDPSVLILDEPAATIDPRARVEMRRLLRDLADTGKAVLVSSHILPELADVCNRVGILRSGQLVACGDVNQILRDVRQKRLMHLRVLKDPDKARKVLAEAPGDWKELPSKDSTMVFEAGADEKQLAQALFLLLKNGIPVSQFGEDQADLEDVFMSLTGEPSDEVIV